MVIHGLHKFLTIRQDIQNTDTIDLHKGSLLACGYYVYIKGYMSHA